MGGGHKLHRKRNSVAAAHAHNSGVLLVAPARGVRTQADADAAEGGGQMRPEWGFKRWIINAILNNFRKYEKIYNFENQKIENTKGSREQC